MDLWSLFGFASLVARAAATSASGRCLPWVASSAHIWRVSQSSTGRTTVGGSPTTRQDLGTRYSYQTGALDRRMCQSSPPLPGSTLIFRLGRPMGHSFTSFSESSLTSWTYGVSVRGVELQSGSPRTWDA